VLGMQALKRIGQPGDAADGVAFLTSDGARWINGTTIDVDGFQDCEATDAAVPNPSKLRDTFMPSLCRP